MIFCVEHAQRQLHQLNDLHVNYAQSLLKRQFPNHLHGFQQRVLNGVTETGLFVNEQLQVIHCQEDHWIAASSIGAKADEVTYTILSILLLMRQQKK